MIGHERAKAHKGGNDRRYSLPADEYVRRIDAQYARGDRNAADAALTDLIANGRNVLAYQIAQVYAWRGETDKAFEWLEISFANHDTGLLALTVDPLLRGLRGDARYKSVLAKVGLPAAQ